MQKDNAVILARVSSPGQKLEGYSLDSQTKLLTDYCDRNSFNVLKVFEIAETASKQQSRKVFRELMEFIGENNVRHLAVEKTDRFTRNFRDAVTIDDWLEADEKRKLHAVKESLILHKYAKSDVKFMWNIYLSVAKKYTDNLREEAMKGWAEKLAQGWLPASPPPGYMTVVTGGKRIHIPDPETRQHMVRVFKRYLEPGESLVTVSKYMTELGMRTRADHPFGKTRMQHILDNPFYIGINRFNGQCTQGAQEPIIPKPLFDAVQQKLHGGRPQKYKRHKSPLQGLIRCEDCGSVVTWQLQKGQYYGVCRRLTEACKQGKMLREDKIEEQVMAAMQRLVCPSSDTIDWVVSEIRRQHGDNIAAKESVRKQLQSELKRIQTMDESLYDDKLAEVITKERYEAKHEQFLKETQEITTRLAGLEDDMSGRLEQRLSVLELTQKAAEIYQTKASEQKRLIISKLFATMQLKGGSLSVKYSKFVEIIAKKVEKTNELLGGEI